MNELGDRRPADRTTRERVMVLVRQVLDAPAATRPLPIDARLSELGVSSIKMVNLMLALEVEFDLTISQAEISPENFTSIESVEALMIRLLAAGSGN